MNLSFFCFVFPLIIYVLLFVSFNFSFGLSEDDAYVDKLPTFERHFDSFAGIVTIQPWEQRGGRGWKKGRVLVCEVFFTPSHLPRDSLFTQNSLQVKGVEVVAECFQEFWVLGLKTLCLKLFDLSALKTLWRRKNI